MRPRRPSALFTLFLPAPTPPQIFKDFLDEHVYKDRAAPQSPPAPAAPAAAAASPPVVVAPSPMSVSTEEEVLPVGSAQADLAAQYEVELKAKKEELKANKEELEAAKDKFNMLVRDSNAQIAQQADLKVAFRDKCETLEAQLKDANKQIDNHKNMVVVLTTLNKELMAEKATAAAAAARARSPPPTPRAPAGGGGGGTFVAEAQSGAPVNANSFGDAMSSVGPALKVKLGAVQRVHKGGAKIIAIGKAFRWPVSDGAGLVTLNEPGAEAIFEMVCVKCLSALSVPYKKAGGSNYHK